jgi:hypothetical protein
MALSGRWSMRGKARRVGYISISAICRQAGARGLSTALHPDRDYWRVRMVQGGVATDWVVGKFRTKVGGYNRSGELYDILSDGFTVGERFGSTTFIAGRGLRLDNATSYVRYQLPSTVSTGEFSMEVEGLAPNGPQPKQNIFSMAQGTGAVTNDSYEMTAQYRGAQRLHRHGTTFRCRVVAVANPRPPQP